jgi:hypothetical protein
MDTATIQTANGPITSFRVAWQADDGRDVYVWRTDGDSAHQFASAAEAEAWIDKALVSATAKERRELDWEVRS